MEVSMPRREKNPLLLVWTNQGASLAQCSLDFTTKTAPYKIDSPRLSLIFHEANGAGCELIVASLQWVLYQS